MICFINPPKNKISLVSSGHQSIIEKIYSILNKLINRFLCQVNLYPTACYEMRIDEMNKITKKSLPGYTERLKALYLKRIRLFITSPLTLSHEYSLVSLISL